MNTNQITVNIQGFRAVQEADITLNGITVVAGENGCGKSTLSKFLYYVFKSSHEYDRLVEEDLNNKLSKYRYFLDILREDLYSNLKQDDDAAALEAWNLYRSLLCDEKLTNKSYWNHTFDYLNKQYKAVSLDISRVERLKAILCDVLDTNPEEKNFDELLKLFRANINELFNVAQIDKHERHANLLKKELAIKFSRSRLPEKYKIAEFNSLIIADDKDTFMKPHSIQQVAYVDTPMLLGIDKSEYDYWNSLNEVLYNQSEEADYNTDINRVIAKDILKGDASVEEMNALTDPVNVFIYQREDGTRFNLLECATGIKSFSILQMLLKNGFLNKYSLLIIDEPESHLHPQWIIEYARLIVLLNKQVGVKFFIASHNPDMVSAIKYISEKEEVDHNLNFYMAEPGKSPYQYTYRHLGAGIEPIFESFNIALDRISLYGTKNEEE